MSRRGSVMSAMGWMIGLSAVLFWLPVIGSLIAGYVGGRKAGSWGRALAARPSTPQWPLRLGRQLAALRPVLLRHVSK